MFTENKLSPIAVLGIDFVCLSYFMFQQYYKTTWRKLNFSHKFRLWAMLALWVIGNGDSAVGLYFKREPVFTNFIRPFVVIICNSQSRSHVKSILHLINDSIATLVSIVLFVAIYSFLGYFTYKTSL